jgi:hypothetical protein
MFKPKVPKNRIIWFERVMAIAATINLTLVLFDLSYIHWRDFYLRSLPELTQFYDPVKGIEPHRETENYLTMVKLLSEQVSRTGLQSQQVEEKLTEVRRLSSEMIDTNPFAAANKSGTLEKIKKRMRDRVNEKSAKKAFAKFWSQAYLSQEGWIQEIDFFNRGIQPLIVVNYYRQIDENGEFTDRFWIIDLPFILLFTIELLGRIYFIKRRHRGFSYLEAILWRWYDLILLLPFLRWLRIIPVVVRLDKADLINLQPLRKQLQQGVVANFAEELTEIVVVRVINQLQGSIQRGELTRWLSQKESHPYLDINNVNEVEALGTIFIQTIIQQVLPKIQPEIIALLRHNIDSVLSQTPIYRNLQNFPGVGQMQTQIAEQMATQIATNLYNAIVSATEDPTSKQLSTQLLQRFTDSFGAEMQKKHIVSEIQSLLSDFLEEVKLNYVQRLSQEDIDQILEQTRKLRVQVQPVVLKSRESGVGSGE